MFETGFPDALKQASDALAQPHASLEQLKKARDSLVICWPIASATSIDTGSSTIFMTRRRSHPQGAIYLKALLQNIAVQTVEAAQASDLADGERYKMFESLRFLFETDGNRFVYDGIGNDSHSLTEGFNNLFLPGTPEAKKMFDGFAAIAAKCGSRAILELVRNYFAPQSFPKELLAIDLALAAARQSPMALRGTNLKNTLRLGGMARGLSLALDRKTLWPLRDMAWNSQRADFDRLHP